LKPGFTDNSPDQPPGIIHQRLWTSSGNFLAALASRLASNGFAAPDGIDGRGRAIEEPLAVEPMLSVLTERKLTPLDTGMLRTWLGTVHSTEMAPRAG